MQTQTVIKFIAAALISLLISACGGGDSSPLDGYNNGGNGGNGNVDTTSPQKIGAETGDDFRNGEIGTTNDITTLSAGGSTTLSVYIVSSTNTPISESMSVSFISDCVAANKAILRSTGGDEVSAVSTINGRATITYTANGCVGTDRVTASVTIGDTTNYAQVDLMIEAGTVGSIQFIDATPTQISLKGSGGQETSIVRFRVLDGNGAPIERATVNFSTSTTSGGLSLTPTSAMSDSEGHVSTTINSGTVAIVVSVTATVADSNISTSSQSLTVSTGVPVQRNASLSFTKFNPRGWDRDGEEVVITMSMADEFGNPVADDTAVTFWTEGGLIGSSCTTEDGSGRCSVTWRSQDFRPTNGRVTVLAFASGNETFSDSNSNGRFDQGETHEDLAEAYRDDNESNSFDINEPFVDLTGSNGLPSGTRDSGNGVYSGTLCYSNDSAVCTNQKITVRKSGVISMSSPLGFFELYSNDTCSVVSNGNIGATSGIIYVRISDINGNSMPSGTTITTTGSTNMTVSELDTVIPNTPNAVCYGLGVTGTAGTSGSFTIQAETEEEEVSARSFTITFN